MTDTINRVTRARVPGLFDLHHLVGQTIGIRVDDTPVQWTRLAQYAQLESEGTTMLTFCEPVAAPWPTPEQRARLRAPAQFRLYADVLLARRLDEPRTDDDTAVVW